MRLSTQGHRRQQQTRLAQDEIDALIADYLDGVSILALAATYRIHRTTALQHLERAGVPRRPTISALTNPDLIEAQNRRKRGDAYAAVARRFGVHPETVRRSLKRHTP